jgi:hypothetical protein
MLSFLLYYLYYICKQHVINRSLKNKDLDMVKQPDMIEIHRETHTSLYIK